MTRTAHTLTITPDDDGGFLLTCPHGCNLGTSARQPDQASAERRAELHYLATAPLTPEGLRTQARRHAQLTNLAGLPSSHQEP
jgi:hypothetical protein